MEIKKKKRKKEKKKKKKKHTTNKNKPYLNQTHLNMSDDCVS